MSDLTEIERANLHAIILTQGQEIKFAAAKEWKLLTEISKLKTLCARAADALRVDYKLDHLQEELIRELREAAK